MKNIQKFQNRFIASFLLIQTIMAHSSPPIATWQSLKKTNKKFIRSSKMSRQRAPLTHSQSPSCIVLCCSDSRVTPEFIFKQQLGNFFVVRVAGNVVDNLVIDSIEFAIRTFNSSLILVLGHSQCGAVIGALQHLKKNEGIAGTPHDHFRAVLIPIEKAIIDSKLPIESPDALQMAIQTNIRSATDKLLTHSSIIKDGIKKGTLAVVGAEYSLETGAVSELFIVNK